MTDAMDLTATVDVKIPSGQELHERYGDFLLRTHEVSRPTVADTGIRHIRDERRRAKVLADAQAKWDRAEAVAKQAREQARE